MQNFNLLNFNELERIKIRIFENSDVQELTRKEYESRLKLFLKFVQFRGLNQNSYLEFKKYLRGEEKYKTTTKSKYLFCAKIFLKELFKQRYTPIDITVNVKGFTQNKKHKKFGLTDDDITKLTGYMKCLKKTPENLRKRALIALFLFQGLRQIEVIRIDIQDLDLKNQSLSIRGKGNDDKELIALHPKTIEALREYLKFFPIPTGALFKSISNNCKTKRLTTKSVREIVKGVFKEAGINNSVHGFRHYYVTKLLKSYQGNLVKVSNYTRHRSLEMLQVYNDDIFRKEDLPEYYKVFNNIKL